MKKLISLALAIVMIMCLSTTAFATTAEAPGDYTAEVTGSYVAGNESNGIVYCVDITWNDLDFTYHAEKGAVWDTDTLTYSEVEPAYWEGEGTIKVTNRSNTKISAVPAYNPAEGYEDADMTFGTNKLKVASAESGTEQTGTITVTPNGFLPAMNESDTIGTITLTIAQDTDVTVEEGRALVNQVEALISQARDTGAYDEYTAQFVSLNEDKNNLTTIVVELEAVEKDGGTANASQQSWLNNAYESTLSSYKNCKNLTGL